MGYQSFYKINGSIVVIVYKKGITVDLTLAKELVKERLRYYNGQCYPTLADIRPVKFFTKEARHYMAKGDAIKGIPAGAILTGNYLTVQVANLYLKFSKPQMPTKAFRTKESAVKWLRQFV